MCNLNKNFSAKHHNFHSTRSGKILHYAFKKRKVNMVNTLNTLNTVNTLNTLNTVNTLNPLIPAIPAIPAIPPFTRAASIPAQAGKILHCAL